MSKNITLLCNELEARSLKVSVSGIEHVEHKGESERSAASASTGNDKSVAVLGLAHRTKAAAEELDMMLQALKLDDSNQDDSTAGSATAPRKRKRTVLNRVVKAVWKDSDVQKLRHQLGELQQELILHLNVIQR